MKTLLLHHRWKDKLSNKPCLHYCLKLPERKWCCINFVSIDLHQGRILAHWLGYVYFIKVIFRGCNLTDVWFLGHANFSWLFETTSILHATASISKKCRILTWRKIQAFNWSKHKFGEIPISQGGHVAADRKRCHQWCLTLTPNNTETIERMTCHCFLRPIRRDLKSTSLTQLSQGLD